jgi:hypothetical protein
MNQFPSVTQISSHKNNQNQSSNQSTNSTNLKTIHQIPPLITYYKIPTMSMNYESDSEPRSNTHQPPHRNLNKHPTKNQDIPECSTANQEPKIHAFSFYPEQIIEEGVRACQCSILGKIITDKSIHVGSIQNGLDSIWGSPAGLKIQEI